MDSEDSDALSVWTDESLNYSILFNFFGWSFPLLSFQYQITVPIPFWIKYFPHIVASLLEMTGISCQ